MMTVTIVIPAYNEAGAIESVVRDLAARYPEHEIMVIDDGSSDETGKIVSGLPCKLVKHEVNRGYGAAWKSGCRAAESDLIVYYDGDGQFDADDVGVLIKRQAETGADMVSGVRQRKSDAPLLRQPGKWVLKVLANYLTRMKIPDLNCGLRIFKREKLLNYLHLLPNGFSASTTSMVLFLKRSYVVEFIPVITKQRIGKSSVRIIGDGMNTVILLIRLIALFEPLRIFVPISGYMMGLSVLYSFYEMVVSGLGVPVLGAVTFIGGLTIFLIGILCDQISAMRLERYENR